MIIVQRYKHRVSYNYIDTCANFTNRKYNRILRDCTNYSLKSYKFINVQSDMKLEKKWEKNFHKLPRWSILLVKIYLNWFLFSLVLFGLVWFRLVCLSLFKFQLLRWNNDFFPCNKLEFNLNLLIQFLYAKWLIQFDDNNFPAILIIL